MATIDSRPTFYEFFAGGGMARLGLGSGWRCTFANDIDARKADAYEDNFSDGVFRLGDVMELDTLDLPGEADLAWASFPCQDVSLAGRRAGLSGARSGAFYGFWRLIEALREEGRAPRLVVLENVSGVMTSNGGEDFQMLGELLSGAGYRFGALEIDAAAFLPHSRPRLFLVAVLNDAPNRRALSDGASAARNPAFGRTDAVREAAGRLKGASAKAWTWWRLPTPPARNTVLADLLETDLAEAAWRSDDETERLLALMDPRHRRRVEDARASGRTEVGAVFRRTRIERGERQQRAEVRFDGLAGCLRTPAGGSSRQFVVICEEGRLRSRALTPRETARLMGAPDDYRLPSASTAALQLTGDGVATPVVRWLAHHLLEPLLSPVQLLAEAS